MKELTPKQIKFCELYSQSGNASAAAKGAGYSQKYSNREGLRLLDNPRLVAHIKELSVSGSDSRIATAAERQAFWTEIQRDKEADMRDRLRASEILGRAHGDFIDNIHITGTKLRIIDLEGRYERD